MNHRQKKNDLYLEAELAIEQGRAGSAILKLNKILENDSGDLTAHFNLALAYLRKNQLSKALFHAKRTLKLNPREANAHLNLGVIYAALGKEALAIRNYNLEIKLFPKSYEAHYNLGRIFIRRHRWKDALIHLARCWMNNHPGNLRDEFLALAAQEKGDLILEEKIYIRRLRGNPRDLWALNNLGAVRNAQGRSQEAFRLFQKALKIRPSDRIAKKNLSQTLRLP